MLLAHISFSSLRMMDRCVPSVLWCGQEAVAAGGSRDACDNQHTVGSKALLVTAVNAQTFFCLLPPAATQKIHFSFLQMTCLVPVCSNYVLFKLHGALKKRQSFHRVS